MTELNNLWLTETIRLREEHAGPLDDGEANRVARSAGGDLPTRIVRRALWLAERDGESVLRLDSSTGQASRIGVGEPVNALWVVVASVCIFAISYRFHSAWLMAKVLTLDELRAITPEDVPVSTGPLDGKTVVQPKKTEKKADDKA